jgi:superfamily I DNA and/or RNA helicase
MRVAAGTQEDYERDLSAATNAVLERLKEDNEVPLCHKCNKKRAWRGECVDCYMGQHSQRVFERGEWRLPDTHNIGQGYYMEEEHYARQRRLERERRDAPKPLLAAAANADNAIVEAKAIPGSETELGFLKNLFQTVQGVKYDSMCPHGEPFYACMCCSH